MTKSRKSHRTTTAAKSASTSSAKRTKQQLLGSNCEEGTHAQAAYIAKIQKLKAENNALRKTAASKENSEPTIQRPASGVAGNGYNLQSEMGLDDNNELYATLHRCVRHLTAKAGLDCSVVWRHQPKSTICHIISAAQQRHPYFKRFPHGWAIEEFIKSNLKNQRAYARRCGYLENFHSRDGERQEEEDQEEANAENGSSDNDLS